MLTRFYGLGTEYTINAIEDFSRKLLVDEEIKQYCQSWIYHYSAPELLIGLLYTIGFVGIVRPMMGISPTNLLNRLWRVCQ